MKEDATSPRGGCTGPASEKGPGKAALAWAVSAGRSEDLIRRVEVSVRRARRRRAAVAVTCVAALLTFARVMHIRHGETSAIAAATAPASAVVSHPAKQVLPDGSVVELNDRAEILVQFSAGERRVILRNGEAHFDVAKDGARTFIVVAGGVEVRAVGTAFAVQLGNGAVEVVVTHGAVAVDRMAAKPEMPVATEETELRRAPPLALVEAGNRVVIEIAPEVAAPPPSVVSVSEAELSSRMAWRVPRLEFSGTPLAEVIPMFNRHNRVKLVLDPALGPLQMSGILRADNIESLTRLLKNEFGIEAERRGETEIHLRRR